VIQSRTEEKIRFDGQDTASVAKQAIERFGVIGTGSRLR